MCWNEGRGRKHGHGEAEFNWCIARVDQALTCLLRSARWFNQRTLYNIWVIKNLTGTIRLSFKLSSATFRLSHCVFASFGAVTMHHCVVSVSFFFFSCTSKSPDAYRSLRRNIPVQQPWKCSGKTAYTPTTGQWVAVRQTGTDISQIFDTIFSVSAAVRTHTQLPSQC